MERYRPINIAPCSVCSVKTRFHIDGIHYCSIHHPRRCIYKYSDTRKGRTKVIRCLNTTSEEGGLCHSHKPVLIKIFISHNNVDSYVLSIVNTITNKYHNEYVKESDDIPDAVNKIILDYSKKTDGFIEYEIISTGKPEDFQYEKNNIFRIT
jgi:hypothetical protein